MTRGRYVLCLVLTALVAGGSTLLATGGCRKAPGGSSGGSSGAARPGVSVSAGQVGRAQRSGGPTARLMRLNLEEVKPDRVRLVFEVEIENPQAASFEVIDLRYSLTCGGSTFVRASAVKELTIQPGQKRVVNLQDEVTRAGLLTDLNARAGATVDYQAKIWLSIRAGGSASDSRLRELAMGGDGQLALPAAVQGTLDVKTHHFVDVVFVPTPQEVVEKMLEMAQVKNEDVVWDLGCGDGRICVTAAKKYGCRAVGYDIDLVRVMESRQNARANGVENLVTIKQKDIFTLDLTEANVITLYLLPHLNVRLLPQLEKVRPGTRIVSHDFGMEGTKPDKVVTFTDAQGQREHTLYLWVAPIKKDDMKTANDKSDGPD